MSKVQPLRHQTHLQPQESCLHPLRRKVLLCLPSLNQSCEYLSCPSVSVPRGQARHWGGGAVGRQTDWEDCLRSAGNDSVVKGLKGESQAFFYNKSIPLPLCRCQMGIMCARASLPTAVCLSICGCKQICLAFAGWLPLFRFDLGLHGQTRRAALCVFFFLSTFL